MSVRGSEGAGATGAEAKERRVAASPRFHFEALVSVGETAGGGFEAESMDVSPDGMRLRTAYLPDVGDKLICRFDGMGSEIVAEGEVAWRNEEAKGGEFGLRFVDMDGAVADALRAMCMTLGDDGGEEPEKKEAPSVPRGSRVRLHIEGLGSPMKARVRESASREVEVGSNLEFLKVGRALELEDVEAGVKREAMIDNVKVDVDPGTNVPQLVVTLRYDRSSAAPEKEAREKKPAPAPKRESVAPAKKRESVAAKEAREEKKSEPRDDDRAEADGHDEEAASAPGFAARATSAGRAVASKVGPALAGVSTKAMGAMSHVQELLQRRRSERTEAKKAAAPRRTTAPPPGGALTSDGRRLVRDDGADEEEIALPMRDNKRAAMIGGALGLLAVLALFGVTRLMSGRGHATSDAHATTAAAALPAATGEVAATTAAQGTPTANVPLFGPTPLSTTEPAPGAAPAAAPSSSAVAAAPPPSADSDDEPAPGDGNGGAILKEWGNGPVSHPVTLKIKMDGPIERITGAAGAAGFTVTVPGHRSVSPSNDLARKDKRLSSVNVVNTSRGAEITVQFKDGVPPYLAKVKGDRLEIAIGKEGHAKVAKKKKKKGHH